jgi:hypothetical protein
MVYPAARGEGVPYTMVYPGAHGDGVPYMMVYPAARGDGVPYERADILTPRDDLHFKV